MIENDNQGGNIVAKGKGSIFFCQECGYESVKWLGQCPTCKAWNSFVEEPVLGKKTGNHKMTRGIEIEPVCLKFLWKKRRDWILK